MRITELERKEFEEVVKPVIKWLNDNCHPHTQVLITPTDAELSEGITAFRTLEFVKD